MTELFPSQHILIKNRLTDIVGVENLATLTRNDSMILNLTPVATIEENSPGACSSYQLMLEHAQNLQENIFCPAAQE